MFRVSHVGRVGSIFFVLLASSSTNILLCELASFLPIFDGTILSREINGRVYEYMDYTESGENHNS